MSPMRSSKKRAMEKLATSNTNKRGCKKKEEIVISDDDLDNLLTNTDNNVSQNKNDSDSNILNDGNGQHEDNNQNNSQICQNDSNGQNNGQSNDDGQNNGQSNDDEAAEVGTNNQNSRPNILQSGLTNTTSLRMSSHDSRSNRQTPNDILSNQIIPSRTDSRSSSHISNDYIPSRTCNSRFNSYILNDYTPSNRSVNQVTPSRTLSRENSLTDYLTRNKFGFLDRNFRIMSEKSTFDYMPSNGIRSSIPKANSPFDYVSSNRTASRLTPLGRKIIPSPFNEMITYQLCFDNKITEEFTIGDGLDMATEGSQTVTAISNRFSILPQEDKKKTNLNFLEELVSFSMYPKFT
ncbi:hypothetical protein C1645_833899 [Glomus cerebriforme]|uniref:Uncharacterized protein n=1 Tax=Glomus cerebriforme TaxID=658196 RepID=A0A397SHE6_9GLOM|nr:hypothetical protein C1645_833899 [Glomus cerebriforme]